MTEHEVQIVAYGRVVQTRKVRYWGKACRNSKVLQACDQVDSSGQIGWCILFDQILSAPGVRCHICLKAFGEGEG